MPGPPRYPLLGSLPDFIKRFGDERVYQISKDYYKEYGTIVRVKLGQDDQVWVYDPREMLKLFLAEGKYPDGPIRLTWPVLEYGMRREKKTGTRMPLMTVGEEWREHRMKLNPGMFGPQAAATYIPQLNETARDLAEFFPSVAGSDLGRFCQLASFDLFCSAVLGKSLRVIDTEAADPRDLKFADDAMNAFHYMGDLIFSPLELFAKGKWDTKILKAFLKCFDDQNDRAYEIMSDIDPTATERSYYRHLIANGQFSQEQACAEVVNLLGAAVDTTATTMLWFIYDLARHPEVQRKAAQELREVLGSGKDVDATTLDFDKSAKLPYFKACYRESLRYSPIGNTGTFRTTPVEIELGGYLLPQGTQVSTMAAAMQFDERYVESPEEYRPERWLPEEVERRKGTEAEIIDHKLMAANFGFGPRMCLGARLAVNEMQSLVARLLLDYEIGVAKGHEKIQMRLLRAPSPAPQLSARKREW